MKPLVFLDFDDVIAIQPDYTSGVVLAALRSGKPHLATELWANVFHQELRANLARLHHEFEPIYVISSSWATYMSRDEIQEALIRGGLGFVAASLHSRWRSATEVGSFRVTDIVAWLRENGSPRPLAYVIIDDLSSGRTLVDSVLEPHTVLCDEWVGFTGIQLERARAILLAQRT
ncbi:HAD domain-containing protein [Janthinobacterium sp.]|uniref:HAD domain-containing protein n=1 Tax=Janthinobacterium sp. TaxID=1871054 RepID=UPI002586897E|nr:HAD domain-containing protein [Janthinobacterium sp.]MCX7292758.1 HAD domain-containing protein [Janthinobacterium sp.]